MKTKYFYIFLFIVLFVVLVAISGPKSIAEGQIMDPIDNGVAYVYPPLQRNEVFTGALWDMTWYEPTSVVMRNKTSSAITAYSGPQQEMSYPENELESGDKTVFGVPCWFGYPGYLSGQTAPSWFETYNPEVIPFSCLDVFSMTLPEIYLHSPCTRMGGVCLRIMLFPAGN